MELLCQNAVLINKNFIMETKLSDFYEMAKAIYEGKKDKSTCLKIAFEKYGAGKPSFKHSFNNYIVPTRWRN